MNRRTQSMLLSASRCKRIIMLRLTGSVTVLALLMVGCGGGGGGGGDSALSPPPPPATYSIGGTVTGLTGFGLVLQTNAGDVAPVFAPGAFTFPSQLGSGAAYTVTVKTQPSTPAQNCIVTNGSGAVGTANITAVAVACATVAGYTVGGTVSGLVGSGLTLTNCTPVKSHGGPGNHPPPPICHSVLQVGANGAFTLDSTYPAGYSGGDYVAITQQPSSPAQNCEISNAAVSIQNANDTNVTVVCLAEYAYVTNAADNTLSSFSIDATTGALAVIGAPIVTGASPHAIVALETSPRGDKGHVYVANEGSNDVSAFAIDTTTGALTALPGSPFPAGKDPQGMALYGPNLYVENTGSDNVSAYGINLSTGALTALPGSPVAVGNTPTSIVVGPYGGSVFVANHGGSNDISAFYYYDLTPVPGSPFPAGGNPLSLALGFGGRFLYSANPDPMNPSISGFSVDTTTGVLSPLSGSPFPLPVSHYMATDQTGAYLYVTTGASIVGYAIDATTGALTPLPGFPVAAGADAYSITVDPSNQFLYVANDSAANLTGFRLDASTGALAPMFGSPFPAGHHSDFIATF
jgi:YVTN family beta-propeller protein